jgi:hypothetical protein
MASTTNQLPAATPARQPAEMGRQNRDRNPRSDRACALTSTCGLVATTSPSTLKLASSILAKRVYHPRRHLCPQELAGQVNAIRQALRPKATRGQSVAWSAGMIFAQGARGPGLHSGSSTYDNGSAVHLRKERSVRGGLPSIKPVVCKIAPPEAGFIWRAAIWALAQAGNRASKTRHHCAAMWTRAQARLQTRSR